MRFHSISSPLSLQLISPGANAVPPIQRKGSVCMSVRYDDVNHQETSSFSICCATMTEWHPLPTSKQTPSWLETLNKEAEKRARELEPASLPCLDHLGMKDYKHVYEPSDDTYLLVDGLRYELQKWDIRNVSFTVEIGCGTGVPTVYLACELKKRMKRRLRHIVTDVNPMALHVAKRTAQANGCAESLETVQCDLASSLLPQLEKSVDILLFNPPYVPTPDSEVGSDGIEASWAGGLHGRRVVDRALPQIAQLLSRPHGRAYLVTVDDNMPENLAEECSQRLGLHMEPLVRRRARNEYLTLQKLTWKSEGLSGQVP